MRRGLLMFFLFPLLAPWAAQAENVERIFTLKDFGLYAISSDIDDMGDAREKRATALARDQGLERLSVIWYAAKDRYPDGAPLGATMLDYGRTSHWTPSLYHGDAVNRDYVMMMGYETTTAEISDDYAEDPDAADALYKGKTLDGRIAALSASSDPEYLTLKGEGGWEVKVFPNNTNLSSVPEMNLFSTRGTITGHQGKTILMDAAIFFPLPPPP